ncbi:MAG: VWA domain-containing protein [Candidatus Methanomethylophilus sp.]|nr:VWA domain-containing protein [Methanomethylophilus sp.]
MPFSAVAGNQTAKTAVLCLLVNPNLKSLLLNGATGTGKTTIVRSLESLDPAMPVINVPIGATEDRLFGSINLEKAVTTGKMEAEKGLFGEADNGVICIDDIDLMDKLVALQALETAIKGEVVIEREGLSVKYDANVKLLATTTSLREGINPHLKDRFDISVKMRRPEEAEYIVSLRNNLMLQDGNLEFFKEYSAEDAAIMEKVREARKLLPQVKLLVKHLDAIARISNKYGVVGDRGTIACAQVAVTLAALNGRKKTITDDVVYATELTLNHRRTIFEKKKEPETTKNDTLAYPNRDIMRFVHDDRPILQKTQEEIEAETEDDDEDEMATIERTVSLKDVNPETLLEINEIEFKEDVETELVAKVAERFDTVDLMEAADYYGVEGQNKRQKYVESATGKYTAFRVPKGDCSDIAIDATIRAAAPHQFSREREEGKVKITKNDIREKVRTKHVENAFYFMLDASGSLVIRNRIGKTKAAILSMLELHFAKRDRVGLMTFNEKRIEEVMPPTRAVEHLSDAITNIAVDTGTPLSQAFMECWRFVKSYRKKHPEAFIHIVVFTDGRATASIDPDRDPCDEALEIAKHLHEENVDWIVVDTGLGTSKSDMPRYLAQNLGGRLFMLDDLQSKDNCATVWGNTKASEEKPQWMDENKPIFHDLERERGLR